MSYLRDSLRHLCALLRDRSGVALIEFAYSLPVLTIVGLGGAEMANYSITNMRVSQLAVSLADNASRAKADIVNGVPHMREYDVNDAFIASETQSGGLDIKNKGRMILSSLEVNAGGGQWIHWQRCYGAANYRSAYGKEGDGITGTSVPGMGPSGRRVTAEEGYAVMFVEVAYNYEPLIFDQFIPDGPIRKEAAMFVRDDRDLSQIYEYAGAEKKVCPA